MAFNENEFCEKLKHLRELRNFTQSYMAGKLGISTRGYSKIEQGTTQLTVKRLYQIAEILNMSVKEILGFSTEMIFNNNPLKQSGGNYVAYNHTAVHQIKELYERLLAQKEEQLLLYKNNNIE